MKLPMAAELLRFRSCASPERRAAASCVVRGGGPLSLAANFPDKSRRLQDCRFATAAVGVGSTYRAAAIFFLRTRRAH